MEWLVAEKLAEEEHYDWNGYYRGEHAGYEELVSYRAVAAGSVHHDGDGGDWRGGALQHDDQGNGEWRGYGYQQQQRDQGEKDILTDNKLYDVLEEKVFCCLQVNVNITTNNYHDKGNRHTAYAAKYTNHELRNKGMCACQLEHHRQDGGHKDGCEYPAPPDSFIDSGIFLLAIIPKPATPIPIKTATASNVVMKRSMHIS